MSRKAQDFGSDEETQIENPDQNVSVISTEKTKKKKSKKQIDTNTNLLNFDEEQEVEKSSSTFTKKKKIKNNQILSFSSKEKEPTIDYSENALNNLKKQQIFLKINNDVHQEEIAVDLDVDMNAVGEFDDVELMEIENFKKQNKSKISVIPTLNEIHEAKLLRSGLRDISTATPASPTGSDDFISFHENGDRDENDLVGNSKRLVLDDGDNDEAFESNEGANYSFGDSAIQEAELQRKKKFQNDLFIAQDEVEDDQVLEWEEEQMRNGGVKSTENIFIKPKVKFKPKVPKPISIPTFQEKLKRLNNLNENILKEVKNLEDFSTTLKNEINESNAKLISFDALKLSKIDKYNFFKEFQCFTDDFTGFLDAKIPVVEKIEKEYLNLFSDKSLDPAEILTKKELIREEKDNIFNDVNSDFKSLEFLIKKYFESWANYYREEYDLAYGTLSLPGLTEIYLRLEMCSWEPFTVSFKISILLIQKLQAFEPLDKMNWHKALCNAKVPPSPNSTELQHLKKCVEKFILPKLVEQIKYGIFDPLDRSCCRLTVLLMQDLENYFGDSDDSWKNALNSIENKLNEEVENVVARFQEFGAAGDGVDMFLDALNIFEIIPKEWLETKQFTNSFSTPLFLENFDSTLKFFSNFVIEFQSEQLVFIND
ncbi:GC-rich sequence DNA-binding factor 2, partial [Clydaea vesicula]